MLGLDNDPLDREQVVVVPWKYSLGGKQYIDAIMRFHCSINLIVNLLKSESTATSEATAGLLRLISSVNAYRDFVTESVAIEEMSGLLRRSSLVLDMKEQSVCALWNLSVDEKFQLKIENSDLLPLLIKFSEDEDIKVVEAARGVLANLALSHSKHKIMVKTDVISKLAKLLKTDEGSKVIRKEAKNILLEFAKDDCYKMLVMEEGLVLASLISTTAYKSFRPALQSWPSLPDGTKIVPSSKDPSRFGASELLPTYYRPTSINGNSHIKDICGNELIITSLSRIAVKSHDAAKFEIQLYKASPELYVLDLQRICGQPFLFLEICVAVLGTYEFYPVATDDMKSLVLIFDPGGDVVTEFIEDLVSGLFLLLYFVSSGLKTNATTIHGLQSWGILDWVIVTTCFGKIVGTVMVFLKMPLSKVLAMGFLMNSKGLVELIVINIGKDKKVMNDQIFAIMVLMALFMTFITTSLVMVVY